VSERPNFFKVIFKFFSFIRLSFAISFCFSEKGHLKLQLRHVRITARLVGTTIQEAVAVEAAEGVEAAIANALAGATVLALSPCARSANTRRRWNFSFRVNLSRDL
jgi:hypothetical protein